MLTYNKQREGLAVPTLERGVETREACMSSSHGTPFFYLERPACRYAYLIGEGFQWTCE